MNLFLAMPGKDLLLKTAGYFLQWRYPFRLLKIYEKWLAKRWPVPNLAQFSYTTTIREIRELYGQEKPVIWASFFFPSEFIHAASCKAFYPEIAGGLIAALGLAHYPFREADQNWFSRDLCSYHRLAVGMSLLRFFPRPAALLATTGICQGTVGFFKWLSLIWKVPCYIVDVPLQNSKDAVLYVARQLEEIASSLSRRLRITFAWEDVFHLSRKTGELIEELEAKRRKKEISFSPPTKNLEYLPYYYQFMGSETALAFFEKLLRESKGANKSSCAGKAGVIWLHLKPYFINQSLDSLLEEFGFEVLFEEFADVYKGEYNVERPFETLARKVLHSLRFMRADLRIKRTLAWLKGYGAQGVIHCNQWGCRQSQGMEFLLRRSLNAAGYPVLFLDGDHLDRNYFSLEQLKTRLQAFREMLG
ncbi:2-hydroxyacyl-CoA dehydratase subunit D [Atrimonas thermophila]|uniref:2-hydroxyacyl-CoA dehydratase subunit D n=1 Tax=Atrimonas thermophila TaxID=3064161 RepID=UPI00399CCFCF